MSFTPAVSGSGPPSSGSPQKQRRMIPPLVRSISVPPSVGDPDQKDPHVFWASGTGSISQRYGSFSHKGAEWREIMLAK